ncbi:hypothetical protein MHIP_59980 [Mycolicibacterium hippocampi]|uniref:Uncharacterized protein n=1 Tax=Mycolicibacterium hippocampi TaxID=659824 RepID=A0A7I9ZWY1_9MYCO|nr:hypothetical protein MHIP_59980 [Mycolicibacterium hippocampi]
MIAVLAGRGGAGASVFATALAQAAAESLLVDGDPWGGGLDLVLGNEAEPGLRWPDLSLAGGRLSYPALRDALPRCRGVGVLSGSRVLSEDAASNHIGSSALAAVIDAGSRAGVPVVCDVARQPTATAETALAAADLVVVVTTADVRSCAAAAATARWASAGNPNTGVVVRGPSPGGLRSVDVARIVGFPVLASMRPEPGLAPRLERGGLVLRRRSPLAAAVRAVLGISQPEPASGASDGIRGMNTPLVDRVRERLAAERAPLRPSVVAAAIRAESGGVLGDTEVLSSLRELQTELVGAGILEPLCAPGPPTYS